MMRLTVLGVVVAAASCAFPTDVVYDALNLWPMPTGVTLPTAPLGPHSLSSASIKVDASCGSRILPLVREAFTLKTQFMESPRTYPASAYAKADSYCDNKKRCNSDGDCGTGTRCVAPDYLRWNPTTMCPPSVKVTGVPCGCCVTKTLPVISTVTVTCNTAGVAESGYTLDVDASAVTITASTPTGASHAVATLSQLMRWDGTQQQFMMDFVPLKITDEPKYSYRGMMLDTSRHFIPVAQILNIIDVMYAAKMNIFHWHIIDSPSFPYESKKYPELSRAGSWGGLNTTVYTQADIAQIMERASSRFVEVMFEFDTPAHTMAFGKSHPEVMTDCWEWMANSGYKVDVDSDDCQAINPLAPAAATIVKGLIDEASALSNSKYFHVGGDEVKYPCWDSEPSIKQHVATYFGGNYARLQANWTANVTMKAVEAVGKVPVCWQPTTDVTDPVWINALPKNTVYMIWLGGTAAAGYAKQGKNVVITSPFYIDGYGTSGWDSVYNAQVMPGGLTPDEQKHVIGGSICAWGEMLTGSKVGPQTLTVGPAAAESFWRDHESSPGPGSRTGLATSSRYNHFMCHAARYAPTGQVMPNNCNVVKGLNQN